MHTLDLDDTILVTLQAALDCRAGTLRGRLDFARENRDHPEARRDMIQAEAALRQTLTARRVLGVVS